MRPDPPHLPHLQRLRAPLHARQLAARRPLPPTTTASPTTATSQEQPPSAGDPTPTMGGTQQSSSEPALPGSSAAAPAGSSAPAPQQQPATRLQHGIRKPKKYIDGTICYGHLAIVPAEPANLSQAFSDKNWKHTMDLEYVALMKNKTWHLVPHP